MEYHVGDLVEANAGVGRFVGVIVDITEHPRREPLYQVEYDGGLGHGSHVASELVHLASEDYPEMGDILYERPDPVRHVAALEYPHDSDEGWQHMLFGCHHTSLGRVLPIPHEGYLRGTPEWEAAWHAKPDLSEHVHGAMEGADTYRTAMGLHVPKIDYSSVLADKDRHARIAKAYLDLPHHDPRAEHSFHAMREQVHDQFHHLTHNMGVHVQFTDHDPYTSHHDLARDLNQHGRLQVLRTATTGSHPLFSDEENDKFRAVHDFFGHAALRRGFDRNGEEAAWHHHASMFTPEARAALTTETRGQNAALIHTGQFQPQKIALLPHEFHSDEAVHGVKEAAKQPQPHDIIEHGDYMHTRDETHSANRYFKMDGAPFSGWIVEGPDAHSDPIATKPEAKKSLKDFWHMRNAEGRTDERSRICPKCNTPQQIHEWLTQKHPGYPGYKTASQEPALHGPNAEENGYKPLSHGGDYFGGGGCYYLATAMHHMFGLPIGATYGRDGHLNHAWVHDGHHAYDAYGVHDHPESPGWSHENAETHMNHDPKEMAKRVGYEYHHDDPYRHPGIDEAAEFAERHFRQRHEGSLQATAGELGSSSVDTGDSVQRTTDLGAIHNVDVANYPPGTLCAMCNLQPCTVTVNHTPVCDFCAESRFGVDRGGVEHLWGQTTAAKMTADNRPVEDYGIENSFRGKYPSPVKWESTHEPVHIPLNSLWTSQRGVDPERARLYAKTPARDFPPVLVTAHPDGTYELVEGRHRVAAAHLRGEPSVSAVIQQRGQFLSGEGHATAALVWHNPETDEDEDVDMDQDWPEGGGHSIYDMPEKAYRERFHVKGNWQPGKHPWVDRELNEQGTEGNRSHITRSVFMHVPIGQVKYMRGAMGEQPGEHRNRQGQDWEDFKEDIRQNGIKHPLFITVDPGERPKLSEGNHRRDAAVELGMKHVPAEVRYYGHSERHSDFESRAEDYFTTVHPILYGKSHPLPPKSGQAQNEKLGLWQDVQAKAARLRQEGKVKLLELPTDQSPYLFGEVEGDHGYYHPIIHREGNKKLAFLCECVWGDYSQNGPLADRRAPDSPYRNRMCSHALALIYELQSRSMFGRGPHLGAKVFEPWIANPQTEADHEHNQQVGQFVVDWVRSMGSSTWSHQETDEGTHRIPIEQARQWIDPAMRDRQKLKAFDGQGYWDNLTNSMASEGQKQPIVVKHTPNGPVIWEGNHRTHVADELGWSHINAKFAAHDSPGDPIEELEDHVETDPEPHRDQDGNVHTGVMVALAIPEELAKEMAVEGGEAARELHVTIGYLGKGDDIDEVSLHQAVLEFCRTAPDSISGKITGFGDFKVEPEFNDGYEHVHIGLVSIPGFDKLRQDLVECLAMNGLAMSEKFGPQPHISIMYSHEPLEYDTMPPVVGQEITWPAVTVAHGGTWRHYPLSLKKTARADTCPECGAEKPFHNFGCAEDQAPRKYFGANDLDKLFGGHSETTAPFKGAGRAKFYDKDLVHETLKHHPQAHELVDFDPRELKATQPGIQRPAMEHYMSGEYDESGRTFADQHNEGNRLPVIYTYSHPVTGKDEHMILSGHHRATRALLRGEMLRARQIRGPISSRR